MANRYRRFFGGTPSYTQLFEIAARLTASGYPASCDLAFQDPKTLETHFELYTPSFKSSVNTYQEVQWFETGMIHPLDQLIDQILLDLLHASNSDNTGNTSKPSTVTCSHCYSHIYDNSDLEGAWSPNPSESCMASMKLSRPDLFVQE